MTKQDLIETIHKDNKWGLNKKSTGEVIEAVFSMVSKAIKKDRRFSYPGFGIFKVRNRQARSGRNPQTGQKIRIKASKTVGFRPAKELRGHL